jgi:diguanylate cyclase (GGDEF)-like protein
MKRYGLLFVLLSVCALPVWAQAGAPLTTLRAITALSNAEAERHIPVAFEATVIYFNRGTGDMNVQEGDEAIFVKVTMGAGVVAGDRVLVRGTTNPSFLPYVDSTSITLLGHGKLPKPLSASYDDLMRTRIVCRRVIVHGVIRAADLLSSLSAPSGRLQLLMEGGYIDIELETHDMKALASLLDAEVEVTGAAGRKFDSKMQQTGAKIKVPSLADIRVLRRAAASPWLLPVTPMGRIIGGYHIRDLTRRVRVHGTITYYLPGEAVVLQNGASSLWVSTQTFEPLQVGDMADATGFPDTDNIRLTLTHAEVLDSHEQAPIAPQQFTWRQLAYWSRNNPGGHQYDLVSTEGRVVTEVREAAQDEYVLVSEGQMFTAIYRHPPPPHLPPPMLQVPVGATIRVNGICLMEGSNSFTESAPFNILLRSFSDIEVVAKPSLLSVRNLTMLVALLFVLVLAVGVWSFYLERKRRHQTAALAYLERRRSLVLEELNNSRPLKEILEHVTELVTFQLNGAASWCEIIDGPCFGQRPGIITSQRVIQQEIHGRSGVSLGTLFAAIPRFVRPSPDELEALIVGTGLAKLAIETSDLYQALVYRSEFDLLTDIPNRFSLEKQLETLIHETRSSAGVFGFIFIDLDCFKQINDQYGHQAGDVYLQEVAQRMKRQLRPGDMLARLGGDEFAVVAQSVHNRTEVEEIAARLERCFDEPFATEGRQVYGSASVGIALYPEDATSRDGLLSTADAAMYAAKQARKRTAA